MRAIGAGLAVFLAVTAILLYQVSSGKGETQAHAAIAAPPPPSTATFPALPSPTRSTTPAPSAATITIASPTAIAATERTSSTRSASDAVASDASRDVGDSAAPEDSAADTLPDAGNDSNLAAFDTTDAWAGAIETPNGGLMGTVLSALANVRALPTVDANIIGVLQGGWPVAIYGATLGDAESGSDLWYQVSGGGYVSSALIGPFAAGFPDVTYSGHWVDVDLTRNVAVAYIDDVPVNAVTVITGKPGFETPVGTHTIFARVESETLDSATVGIPEGDPEYYYLPDVPYTQYFATGGFAIHANYWSDPWQFGAASSHGCVNMLPEDAAWFWWFLDIGSTVNIHY